MYTCVKSLKGVAHLPFCDVSLGSCTAFTDFLVRQSIVPSAMLVMANKMEHNCYNHPRHICCFSVSILLASGQGIHVAA